MARNPKNPHSEFEPGQYPAVPPGQTDGPSLGCQTAVRDMVALPRVPPDQPACWRRNQSRRDASALVIDQFNRHEAVNLFSQRGADAGLERNAGQRAADAGAAQPDADNPVYFVNRVKLKIAPVELNLGTNLIEHALDCFSSHKKN